jgi:hypothetical protein
MMMVWYGMVWYGMVFICPNEPVNEAECVSAYAGFFFFFSLNRQSDGQTIVTEKS